MLLWVSSSHVHTAVHRLPNSFCNSLILIFIRLFCIIVGDDRVAAECCIVVACKH